MQKAFFLLILSLIFSSCTPLALENPQTNGSVSSRVAGLEKAISIQVNKRRIKDGKRPLLIDLRLATLSRDHCRFLAKNAPNLGEKKRKISHYGSSIRSRKVKMLGYGQVGEVVATGWGNVGELSTAAVDSWMTSRHHRKAILSKNYQVMGVGAAFDNKTGFYITGLLTAKQPKDIITRGTF